MAGTAKRAEVRPGKLTLAYRPALRARVYPPEPPKGGDHERGAPEAVGRPSVLFGHEGRAGVPARGDRQPAPMYAGRAPHPLGALPRTPAGKAPAGPTRKRRAGRGVDAMNTSTRGGVFVSTQAINNARALFPSFPSFTQSKTPYIGTAQRVRRVYMAVHPHEGQPRNETRPGSDEGPRSALLFPLVVFIPRPLSFDPPHIMRVDLSEMGFAGAGALLFCIAVYCSCCCRPRRVIPSNERGGAGGFASC